MGDANRDEVVAANERAARLAVETFRPDVLLAGNLMFLDRRFLEGLYKLSLPLVYFLTDVWADPDAQRRLAAGLFPQRRSSLRMRST